MKREEARADLFRVLLVEDDPLLLSMYGAILSKAMVQVEQSTNGHDALEKLSVTPYDLVVCDLNLPGVDGIFLLQWIQRHRPMTTTIVISGYGSTELILAAMRAGAKDYLVKPFGMLELEEVLHRWCRPQLPCKREVFSSLIQQVMHDVRGELIHLECTIKMVQQGKFGEMDAGVSAALLTMQGKIGQLQGITTDYCLMARNLLHGRGYFPTERIGLQDQVIAHVLDEMRDALQRKEIRVSRSHYVAAGGDAYVIGNRLLLKSVFRTLFSNAIKHCRTNGIITYGITNNARRYKIQVANEGEIVPAQLRERIFDEFVQVHPEEGPSGQEVGLGLGLALAKDILRQHGGDIWYESFAKGSKFIFTLPLSPEPPVGLEEA